MPITAIVLSNFWDGVLLVFGRLPSILLPVGQGSRTIPLAGITPTIKVAAPSGTSTQLLWECALSRLDFSRPRFC